MPKFTYSEGFNGDPAAALLFIQALYTEADYVSGSGASVEFQFNFYTLTVTGTGLTTGQVNGRTALTGGTIDAINSFLFPGFTFDHSDLGLDAATLAALAADPDPQALDLAMMQLDWEFLGNSTNDTLRATQTSSSGATINMAGDNTFDGLFGGDIFFAGDGEDKLFGGRRADSLHGGKDDDEIYGGNGRDDLSGGLGRDRVVGGDGADTLSGGAGRDQLRGGRRDDILEGGQGNDVLFGGTGADIFVFDTNAGDDILRDWENVDRLEILAPGPVTETVDGNGDVVVNFTGGTVTLRNVAPESFDLGDAIL
ncbi:MAG: calcium-binding protein [Pseudomonadota bacterium]